MLDLRLLGDHEAREEKGRGEKRHGRKAPENRVQNERAMGLRLVITVLCGVGLYASLFMQRKAGLAKAGLLQEPSVVQTSRARLLFGMTNASFGIAYYLAMGIGIWFVTQVWQAVLLFAASLAAAAMSAVLAYSLLFVTKRSCPYCWTSHAVNGLLMLCNFLGLVKIIHWH